MCLFIASERTGAMVQRWQQFGHSEGQAPGSSQPAISSSSLFRNQRCARCCFSSPKSVPPLALRSQPPSTCWADRSDHHLAVRSAMFELSAPFSDTLHSHYVITIQKHVSPTKHESHTNFAGTVSQCITISHQLIL